MSKPKAEMKVETGRIFGGVGTLIFVALALLAVSA